MTTVSVIIPAFNCESYINTTISSILDQTIKDVEIIVVDDGSTDSTASIVAAYGDRVKLISQNNLGVCSARNRGIREATGKYICLMDHDDFWFPEKLQRQLQEFQTQPDLGVVYSAFIRWHPDPTTGDFPDPLAFDLSQYTDDIDGDFSGWIYHQFLLDCWMLTSTAMFRREVFSKCGVFDETLPFSEDWELWIRVAREYPFAMLRRPTTLYRQHLQQGNRLIRDIDYRTVLLSKSAKQWGFCSRDGRCIKRSRFHRQLAGYHASFAFGHLKLGHLRVAINSLLKAWLTYPIKLKYLAYIAAALTGWRPSW